MENYEQVFKDHDGHISDKWLHYFSIYDRLLSRYREKNHPLTILEIGVDRGGSLEIWKKYLPEGSKIYGVDINPKCSEIPFSSDIFFHLGSASDKDFMEKTFHGLEFDIILDDGSHKCSDVVETFEIMFPKLKNGGIYIVEDLHASYWKSFGGGVRRKGSSIEYFKNFVEALNSDHLYQEPKLLRHIAKHYGRSFADKFRQMFSMFFRKADVSKEYFGGRDYARMMESIVFYDSICAVTKFSSPKTGPFKRAITGKENIGGVNCWGNELVAVEETRKMFGK